MKSEWVSHLKSREEQLKFKEFVQSSQPVLSRLSDLMDSRLRSGEVVKANDYDSPSWAFKQADRNGYLRAVSELKALLNTADQAE